MLLRNQLFADIRSRLAILEFYIAPGGSLNLININVHAEKFVCDLLNLVFAWNLESANQQSSNYPCIDLIDEETGIGVQVTSESGSGKINRTIECLAIHNELIRIQKLKVFSLIKKQTSYSIHATCLLFMAT